MSWNPKSLLAAGALSLLAGAALATAEPDNAEVHLRQALRDATLQMNQAQADLAGAQAAQAAQADENKALKSQLALMTKHVAEDRTESGKTINTLRGKVAAQAAEIARLADSLSQWKVAAEKLSVAGRNAEAERGKAVTGAALLARRVEDLKGKNERLYRLGNEILSRYEKFSLGEQFLAREPFIGRVRVELENQIQEYGDQLLAQKAPQ